MEASIHCRRSVSVFVVAIAAFLMLLGCSSGGGIAKEVLEMHKALTASGSSSLRLIDDAIREGSIDEETALIYKVYSVFGDDRLPEKYDSGKLVYEGTQVMNELTEQWETLSPQTKATLEPFRKRPDEQGSWINLRSPLSQVPSTGWLAPKAHAERASVYTEYFVSADGKVKIWYPSVSLTMRNIYVPGTTVIDASVGKKMAERIKGFLDRDLIIAEFEALLGRQLMSDGTRGGDGKLDIYVAPCGRYLGLTYPESATPSASHIIMNYAIGLNRDVILKTTLAHEIFHAFQYVYRYDVRKDDWWSEATAVWAEDFIYPADNTEHGWVERFLKNPDTPLHLKSPPDEHHYSAYVFPYFIKQNGDGDDFMKKSWEACDGGDCLQGIDRNIDGGFKKQWKEFTLWNYNKEPAQYYMDMGPFPTDSSESGGNREIDFVSSSVELNYDIKALQPLTSAVHIASVDLQDDKETKKLTFKNLRKFTGSSDRAGLKAVLYFKNGKTAVEDWTERDQRSFCLENPDERLEKAVLIFSNSDMKKAIPDTTYTTIGQSTCFVIDQEDRRTAVIHFPYMNAGAFGTININTSVLTRSEGEPEKEAPKEAQYGYQTAWKLWYEFEQIRDAFTFPCGESTLTYQAGWTTRAAGYLSFDLSPENVGDDGTFPVDLLYGYAHPKGHFEEVPAVEARCIGVGLASTKIDVTQFKGTLQGQYTGKITDMTADGATIELPNACMYHHCASQDGTPFQNINEKILLQIQRGENN